jgi:hypothetical protein
MKGSTTMTRTNRLARTLATLGIVILTLAGIGDAAHAHAASAHRWVMYLNAHWNDDGTIEVLGTNFSRDSRVYVEVYDAETGDVVTDGDVYTDDYGAFDASTDYIGCYENPYTGNFDDVWVAAKDLRTGTIVRTTSFDGCP